MGKARPILYVLLIVLLIQISIRSQDNSNSIVIFDVNSSNFPLVSFTARVNGNGSQTVTDLTGTDFSIGENHEPGSINVTPVEGRLNTVIILDRQPISEGEQTLYREFLDNFSNIAYRDGDNLQFTWVGAEGLTRVASPSQMSGSVRNDVFHTRYSNVQHLYSSIDLAVRHLQDAQIAGLNTQIIIVGSYLSPVDSFQYNSSIPIHVVQLHGGSRNNDARIPQRFSGLVQNGGSNLSLTAINSQLTEFFRQIDRQRTLYHVEYISRQGVEGVRYIPVSARNISGTLTYTFNVRPPSVQIIQTESEGNKIFRNGESTEISDGVFSMVYEKVSEDIIARVTFPDEHARQIVSARLVINGVEQETITPEMYGNNEFLIRWDVSKYENDVTEKIAISVTDGYNLTSTSADTQYDITVVIQDACYDEIGNLRNIPSCQRAVEREELIVTMEETIVEKEETIIEQVGTIIEKEEAIIEKEEAIIEREVVISEQNETIHITKTERDTSLMVNIGLAVTLIVLVIIIYLLRKRLARAASNVSKTITEGFNVARKMTKTLIFEGGGATKIEDDSPSTLPYGGGMTQPDYSLRQGRHRNPGETILQGGVSEVFAGRQTEIQPGTDVFEQVEKVGSTLPKNLLAVFQVLKPEGYPEIPMDSSMTSLSLGRKVDHGVDYIIDLGHISGLHCKIMYDHVNGTFTIQDEESANGTYLDNKKLRPKNPVPLNAGSLISLGKKDSFLMRFVPSGQFGQKPAPRAVAPQSRLSMGYQLVEDEPIEDEFGQEDAPQVDDFKQADKQSEMNGKGSHQASKSFGKLDRPEDDDVDNDDWLYD